ncbi:MAG: hypothetical protein PHT88_00190 [Candidatus Moranbacteria bacterium]|nr:hypothetical protein [Candidatus Moranbacteria bacterium]
MSDTDKLLAKIKSRGHWKVVIRPTEYSENLIPSLEDCKRLIEESSVSLRGWDYPYIDRHGNVGNASANSVHSMCDWDDMSFFEYWRFYKTGQFVHYFSMREDWEIDENKKVEIQRNLRTKSDKFLGILSTLYSITEIFEFGSRLFTKLELVKGVEIIIELHGVNGRTLFFWDSFMRILYKDYTCVYTDDLAKISLTIPREDLIRNSTDLALRESIKLFREAFNWSGANEGIFREDQKKLLERRL